MSPLIEPQSLLEFAFAALLIEVTPGPNMGYLAIVAAQRGVRSAAIVVAGVALGLAIALGATAFGVAEGALRIPLIREALRWAGTAYMLWLAWDAWHFKTAASQQGPHPLANDARLFGRGVATNVLNLKSLLFYGSVLPNFIVISAGHLVSQTLFLGAVHIAIATAIHTSIIVLATTATYRASRAARAGKFYAFGLVCVAAWIAWIAR